jgi:hypothetical protein
MRTIYSLTASLLLLAAHSASASTPACGPTEHKIARTIIPKVSFSNAVLPDVISFIRDASVEYDPDHDEPTGVDILVDADEDILNTRFTMELRYVSLRNLLSHVARIAGLRVRPEGRIVLLSPDDGPILNRVYDVLPSTFAAGATGGLNARQFLTEMGIQFPKGSTVCHVPSAGKLFAANTAKNLVVLERALSIINVLHYQVELTCDIVALPPDSSTNLHERLAAGESLFSITALASCGQTSSNRITDVRTQSKSGQSVLNAELKFTPSVSVEGLVVWLSYEIIVTLPGDRNRTREYQSCSQVSIYNGEQMTLRLSPAVPAGDSRDIAITLSPRLIDPAGRIIKIERDEILSITD